MAGAAVFRRARVFTRGLAPRDDPVVAGIAAACDFVVIHPDLCPARYPMTAFAAVRRSWMARRLTCRGRAVVTAEAIAADAIVTEGSRQPCIGRVATVAPG